MHKQYVLQEDGQDHPQFLSHCHQVQDGQNFMALNFHIVKSLDRRWKFCGSTVLFLWIWA